jgi:limonene-1,2-epoxide hydrolase
MQVPVAEPCPPADPREPVRHVVRVQRRPQDARKIKSCSRQAGPIAIRSSARRARWRRSSSTTSGVRKRVRRERAVLSSPITRRVRSSEVDARSRTRFTACGTFRVADSQSRADQCKPNASPRRGPNASITISNGSSRVPGVPLLGVRLTLGHVAARYCDVVVAVPASGEFFEC